MGATTRTEHDSLGDIEVPADRLWGASTERARQLFTISTQRMPLELIYAVAEIKRAAARANGELGVLPDAVADAIVRAATEVLEGRHNAEFPLHVWQSGSGTQTHLNVIEVLANRASELLGGGRGAKRTVHPSDQVNAGQSSNDVISSALNLAALISLRERLVPALDALIESLRAKGRAFAQQIKLGRTHLQDALPVSLGDVFTAYAAQLHQAKLHIESVVPYLRQLALGGTAVGTGLNAAPGFADRALLHLSDATGFVFDPPIHPFVPIAAHDAAVQLHGGFKALAVALCKVANDLRWLASGPRAGLGELRLPENEPGSSIMPGKVNPTQAESLLMICAQVIGNDAAVTWGGAAGTFELNTSKPLIIHNVLGSCRLLAEGCQSFRQHCVDGLTANEARLKENVESSLMLVTALTPHIGYDKAAAISRKAHAEGTTLREAALALGLVTAEQFDEWIRPEEMAKLRSRAAPEPW